MADRPRRSLSERDAAIAIPPMKTPRWLQGFVDFIRGQGVVGVAVGLIFGLAAKSLVDSFVFNIVNPIVGVILGGNSLDSKFFCLKSTPADVCTSKIAYGTFLGNLISFLIMAVVVYFVIKGLKLEKLDKKKPPTE